MLGPAVGAPSSPAVPNNGLPMPPPGGPLAKSAEEMVVDVQVEGNRGVATDKVLAKVRTRKGRPYDPETIEKDVRELNRMKWFVTVKPLSKQVPGGRLVIFQVVERPLLKEVLVIGNDGIWTKTLKKKLEECGVKIGEAADPFSVEEGRRKVEDYYHEKGFSKVRVTILEGNRSGDLRAIYVVNEGPKQKVLWIRFVGNSIASGQRLLTQIKSSRPILYLFKGEVDRKQIDEDVERLTAYYRGLGFFRARIGRELEFNEKQNWLWLTFVIDEGPRYKVRNVSFIGNTKYTHEQLAERLKLQGSQYYNQAQMLADVRTIQEKYGSIGYVFADVKAENRFLDEPGQLDLVYNLTEGDRYRVGRINVEIKGENPHTRITTVLNRLSLRPGDIVDTRELQASERRLKASGLFMVDPSKGIQPKIVFNPPDSEDKDKESDGGSSVARKPKRQTTFYRGPGDGVTSLPPLPPGERYLDVVLPGGDWGQVEPPPQFAGPQQSAPGQVPAGVWGNDLRDVRQAQAVGQAWERQGVESRGYGTYSSYGSHASYPSQGHMHTAGQGGGMVAPGIGKLETCPTGPGKLEAYPTVPSYPPAPPPDGPVEPMEEPIVVRGQYTADAMSAPPTTSPGFAAPMNAYPPPNRAPQGYGPSYPPQTTVVAPGYNYAPNNNYAPPPANAVPSPGPVSPNGQQWYSPTPPPGQQFQQGPAVAPNQQLGTVGAPRPYPPAGITPPISDRVFGDPAYTTPTPNGEPLRDLPLFIRTDENQTGRLMFGVGVNSDAGVVGSVVLDEQNFDWTRFPTSWEEVRNATAWRGAGQKFRVELVPGTQVQRYMINFQEPYLGYSDVSLGLSAFYFDRIYTEWRENRVGGRISLGYQLTHDLSVNTAFRGMNVHLTPYNDFQTIPIIEQSSGNNGLYGFQVSLAHDTRDNPFLATQGHLLSASFEQVVGKFKYPRAEIEASQYFKLYERPDGSGRHVLSLTTHVGYTGDNTPVYERFFAGGFSSLRGFRFRGVSPVEYTNSGLRASVGGNFELLASIQYLFPITADDMLRGVVFCDTGTVEPSISDWNAHYRVAPGFGLRIVIPALGPAPIALDFAFPVSKQNGDQTEMFSFFVGFNR